MNFLRKHLVNILLISIAIGLVIMIWLTPLLFEFEDESILVNPLVQTMLTVIVGLGLFFIFYLKRILKYKIAKNAKQSGRAQIKKHDNLYKEQVQKVYNNLNLAFQIWGNDKDHYLKKLPWYVMIGDAENGKSTFLTNTDLDFSPSETLHNKYPKNRQTIWQFSKQAVILDIPSHASVAQDLNDEHSSPWGIHYNDPFWGGLFALIKKYRQRQPINGIIVTISLPNLLLQTSKQHKLRVQRLNSFLQAINSDLEAQIPVYFVLTKCDLLAGFQEFFADLSFEDREQIYGIYFPSQLTEPLPDYYNVEFDKLINRLQERLLLRLENERDLQRRNLITYFPQQLQLFKYVLSDYINLCQTAPIRGLYFVSNLQQGKPHDFLMSALSQVYQLPATEIQETFLQETPYFAKHLFSEIILKESAWAGVTAYSERRKKRKITAAYITLSLASFYAFFGLTSSYVFNKHQMEELKRTLPVYEQSIKTFNTTPTTLPNLIPLLNELNSIYEPYRLQTRHYIYYELLEPYMIAKNMENVWWKVLTTQYMTEIKNELERTLVKSMPDHKKLYFTLKGYFSLSDQYETSPSWINTAITMGLETTERNKIQNEQILYFLNEALKYPIKNTDLNLPLIVKTQQQLRKTDPVEFAYDELKLDPNFNLKQDNMLTKLGPQFNIIFKLQNEQLQSIPYLYTISGYKDLYGKKSKILLKEAAKVNHLLGLNQTSNANDLIKQMTPGLWRLYNQDYIAYWDKYLSNVHIRPFQNLSNAIDTIDTLTKNETLLSLLDITKLNTYPIRGKHFGIAAHYAKLNAFTGIPFKRTEQYSAVIKSLTVLKNYLITINSSPDVAKMAFEESSVYLQNKSASNPIIVLKTQAQQLPDPLKTWLIEIADNSVGVMLKEAHRAINDSWQSNVYPQYLANIAERYPFKRDAQYGVEIGAFGQFFGLKGTYNQFIKNYIKPFVDTSRTPWRPYQVGKHTIGLSPELLQQLERAALIQRSFFLGDNTLPSVQFTIRPKYLDVQAASIYLQIGNQRLTYQHGPLQAKNWQWYVPNDQDQVSLSFTDFQRDAKTFSYDGPWAWYKLLESTELKQGGAPGHYIWRIKKDNHEAVFDLIVSSNLPIFDETFFSTLRLPNEV